jgi:threonine/homoserine/homoserine lactone efflux protein
MIGNLLKIFTANIVVLVIPGINFYLISNVAMSKGVKFGAIAALGVTCGIMLHVVLSIFGSYTFFNEYPQIFKYIKIAGVVYIIFIAFKLLNFRAILSFFRNSSSESEESNSNVINSQAQCKLGNSKATCFFYSFFVDLLNPYVSCFYFALFAQVVNSQTTYTDLGIYILFIFILTFSWFGVIALLFSRNVVQNLFGKYKQIIENLCAVFLLYFAAKLYFSPI